MVEGRTLLGLAQAYETYGVRPVKRNNIQNVTFYVMSSNDEAGLAAGQYWTTLSKFPSYKSTNYYLHGDRSLSTTKPTAAETVKATSYIYDPTNPVPTLGGNNLAIACGPLDQSSADLRSDVLTFNTEKFTDELVMTGPLFATLFVGSDAIDTDFTVSFRISHLKFLLLNERASLIE